MRNLPLPEAHLEQRMTLFLGKDLACEIVATAGRLWQTKLKRSRPSLICTPFIDQKVEQLYICARAFELYGNFTILICELRKSVLNSWYDYLPVSG